MARTVEQVTSLRRVQVEEDSRHDNDLLAKKSVKEVQTVGYVGFFGERRVKRGQVEPYVEGCLRDILDAEADLAKTLEDEIAFLTEVGLQGLHLLMHEGGLEHGDGGFLEGDVGATVEVRACGAEGVDKFLGPNDPGDTPAR